jgi:hypothetical protein
MQVQPFILDRTNPASFERYINNLEKKRERNIERIKGFQFHLMFLNSECPYGSILHRIFLHSPYSCCSTVRTTSLPILALESEKGKFPMATCSCCLWASPPFSATLAASAPNTDHTRPDTASSRPRRHRVNRRVCVMRRNGLNSQQHPHPVAAAHTICRRLVTDLSAAVGFDGCRPNWATLGSQKVHCHTSQFAGRRHPAAGCTATRPTTEPSLAAPLPVVRRRARRVPIRSSRVRRSRRQRVATTEALPRARLVGQRHPTARPMTRLDAFMGGQRRAAGRAVACRFSRGTAGA